MKSGLSTKLCKQEAWARDELSLSELVYSVIVVEGENVYIAWISIVRLPRSTTIGRTTTWPGAGLSKGPGRALRPGVNACSVL